MVPAPHDPSTSSVDDALFEYLEAHDRSPDEASEVLARLMAGAADGGAALRRAVDRLADSGFLDRDEAEGRRVGPWILERRIGRGGMGEVYRATHATDTRVAAVKVLRAEFEGDTPSRLRFERELAILRSLSHPSIARLLDDGVHDDLPWLAFELIEGVSLDAALGAIEDEHPGTLRGTDLLRALERGPADDPRFAGTYAEAATAVLLDVLRALAHAHSRGIVHRDVKPANVMLAEDGRVVLLDFGLAGIEGAERLTTTGSRVGSLPYMAPELLRGSVATTPSADVYAAGVTLAQLLTGRLPFEARSADRMALDILAGPGRSYFDRMPRELARVIRCAMDPDRRLRYGSADQMAADLAGVLEGRAPTLAAAPSIPTRMRRWAAKSPGRAALVAVGAAVLFVAPTTYGVLGQAHARETERLNGQLASALAEEEAARDSATEAASLALAAIDEQLRRVSRSVLDSVPGGFDLREELLDQAFELLDALPETPDLVSELNYVRGALLRSRGDLDFARNRVEDALEAYAAEERILRSEIARSSDHPNLQFELGSLLAQMAQVRSGYGIREGIEELYEDALPLMEAGVESSTRPNNSRLQIAQAIANRGLDRMGRGLTEEALDDIERAEAILEVAGPTEEADRLPLALRAQIEGTWAVDAEHDYDWSAAVLHRENAIEALTTLIETHPYDRRARLSRAAQLQGLALAHLRLEDYPTAEAAIERSKVDLDALARDFPDWSAVWIRDVEVEALLGQVHAHAGRTDEALAAARGVTERWRAADEAPYKKLGLLGALSNEANLILLHRGEDRTALERASGLVEEALELADDKAGQNKETTRAGVLYNRAAIRARLGELPIAVASAEEMATSNSEQGTDHAYSERLLADAWSEIAAAAEAAGDDALVERAEGLCMDALERAVAKGYPARGEIASHPLLERLHGTPRFQALVGAER